MEIQTVMHGNWSWEILTEDGRRKTDHGSLKVYGDYVIIGGNMYYKPKSVRMQ